MAANSDDPRQHLLTRADLDRLALSDRVESWLATGDLEKVGELQLEGATTTVLAVHSAELRDHLIDEFAREGRTTLALTPLQARTQLLRVMLAERGIHDADAEALIADAVAADGGDPQEWHDRAPVNDPVSRTMDNLNKAMAELLDQAAREETEVAETDVATSTPVDHTEAVHDAAAVTEEPGADAGDAAEAAASEDPPAEVLGNEDGEQAAATESEGDGGDTDDVAPAPPELAEESAATTPAPPAAAPTPKFDLAGLDDLGAEPATRSDPNDAMPELAPTQHAEDLDALFDGPHDRATAAAGGGSTPTPTATTDVTDAMDVLFGESGPAAAPPEAAAPAANIREAASVAVETIAATTFDPTPQDAGITETTITAIPAPSSAASAMTAAGHAVAPPMSTVNTAPVVDALNQIHLALLTLAERPNSPTDLAPVVNAIDTGVRQLGETIAKNNLADVLGQRLDRLSASMTACNAAIAEVIATQRHAPAAGASVATAVPIVAPTESRSAAATLVPAFLMILGWCGALWLHTGDPRTAILALIGANILGSVAMLLRRR